MVEVVEISTGQICKDFEDNNAMYVWADDLGPTVSNWTGFYQRPNVGFEFLEIDWNSAIERAKEVAKDCGSKTVYVFRNV